jgi:hypothetical protein
MIYYFCGYFISYNTLKKMMPPHIEVHITSGFWPHVRWMAELVNSPTNTLNVTWEMFQDARPLSLPRGSADEDDDMGLILVRVEGDLAEGPQLFRETDGDKRVKRIVEEHLSVDLGTFMTMHYTL